MRRIDMNPERKSPIARARADVMNNLPLKAILVSLLALNCTPARAAETLTLHVPDQFTASIDQSFNTQSVSGNREMSSVDTGGHYLTLLDLSARKGLADGALFEFQTNVRIASDRQITTRHRNEPEILRIVGRYVKPGVIDVSLGDIYPRYSPYSLTRSLEGGTATLWLLDKPDDVRPVNSATTNLTLARVHRHEGDSRFSRYAGALRAETGKSGKWSLSANVVHTWDDHDSNDNAQLLAINNWVGSLHHTVSDVSLGKFRYMTLDTEVAYAWQTEDSRAASEEKRRDLAWRANLAGRFMGAHWGVSYEEVGPDFVSSIGSAASDQALFNATTRLDVARWLRTSFNYNHYRNNLDGQLAATTRTHAPGITLDFRALPVKFLPLPEWQNLSFLLGLQLRDTEKSDGTTDWQRYLCTLGANYHLKRFNAGLTQTLTYYDDYTDTNNDYREATTTALFGLRDVPLTTWLKSSFNVTASYTGQTADDKTDDYWLYGLSLSGTAWQRNAFNIVYNFREINKDSLDNADYKGNLLRAEWSYRLESLEGMTCSLRYILRDNSYSEDVRDYQEELAELNLRMVF